MFMIVTSIILKQRGKSCSYVQKKTGIMLWFGVWSEAGWEGRYFCWEDAPPRQKGLTYILIILT